MIESYTAYLADENETKIFTAWDLAADWWWMEDYSISTGRSTYTHAEVTRGYQGVRFQRLYAPDSHKERPRVITRYVDPEMPVRLVNRKMKKGGAS